MNQPQQLDFAAQIELVKTKIPKGQNVLFRFKTQPSRSKTLAFAKYVKECGGAVITVQPMAHNDLPQDDGHLRTTHTPGQVESLPLGKTPSLQPAGQDHSIHHMLENLVGNKIIHIDQA